MICYAIIDISPRGGCEFGMTWVKINVKTKHRAILYALLAAALYAINIPLSKLLLQRVQPAMMAAFLYLGAGVGLFLYGLVSGERKKVEHLTKADFPYTVGMILLDIAAPVLLMLGLERTSSANASLLNNFEIVATSLIAALVFKEALSRRLVAAIALVTTASIVLSFEGEGSFQFNDGSLLILAAACCWGLENNCTRMLSGRSSVQITTIKGVFCGAGSLIVALVIGERFPAFPWIPAVMLLGFVAYGMSINFYIRAQKNLGAAKTSAFYSVAPFLGAILGMILLGERPGAQFYVGLAIMAAAAVLMGKDTIGVQHSHVHTHVHSHAHCHGDLIHTHEHTHVHSHLHVHGEDEAAHGHSHEKLEGHEHTHP